MSLALGACSPNDGARNGGIDDRFSPSADMVKIRNVGMNTCVRVNEGVAVSSGREVYQSRCGVDSASLWWTEDCSGQYCKYVNAASGSLCLKASSTFEASGGSYEIYAQPCEDDRDQQWLLSDRGDARYQLRNRRTERCMHATLQETTSQGFPQTVQKSCGSGGTELLFEFLTSDDTEGGEGGGGGDAPGPDGDDDDCHESTDGSEPDDDGGEGGGSSDGIVHVGTTETYDSNGQDLTITRPALSEPGDLLVLVLHRTDDDLPLRVDGWTRAAECYKRNNDYDCSTEDDCTIYHDDDFCEYFGDYGRHGHDLAQSVFFRTVGAGEPNSYEFDLNVLDSSGHPGWAILTALRGADTTDPVRDWSHEGCDGDSDSVFPSVRGEPGDMVLLSQSFDDATAQSNFGAPTGTSTLGYVSDSDEAGFLFGGLLSSSGETGPMETQGDGASSCKDALVSLTIRPQ